MAGNAKIAIVEDDPGWGELILRLVKDQGYEAVYFPTAGRFFDALVKTKPDMVILDMQLPGMHGREVIRVLRANAELGRLLIIAVSGHDIRSEHAIKAFESGADEYLAKPLDEGLLVARMAALLRRSSINGGPPLERLVAGPLVIVPEQRLVLVEGKAVELTHLEFELLVSFVRQPNRVLTRSLILETVWGTNPTLGTRTVDKHVESLRRKLGPFGKNLETVIRVGYMLKI